MRARVPNRHPRWLATLGLVAMVTGAAGGVAPPAAASIMPVAPTELTVNSIPCSSASAPVQVGTGDVSYSALLTDPEYTNPRRYLTAHAEVVDVADGDQVWGLLGTDQIPPIEVTNSIAHSVLQIGHTYEVRVWATEYDYGTTGAVSTCQFMVRGPVTSTTPHIVGSAQAGGTLTAKPGHWEEGATLTYQWKADGAAVAGATAATFVPRAAQVGKKVTVVVTGSKSGYTRVAKTSPATAPVAASNLQFGCQGHVQNIGWQPWVTGGQVAGTTGRSLRLEALRFRLNSPAYSGGVVATAHVQNIGWMPEVQTGGVVGTQGRSLRVEAVTIKLTGEMAKHYDVYYRTHAQNFGWLGWAKNGARSGTAGLGYRLEAVEVRLVAKGDPGPSTPAGLASFVQR